MSANRRATPPAMRSGWAPRKLLSDTTALRSQQCTPLGRSTSPRLHQLRPREQQRPSDHHGHRRRERQVRLTATPLLARISRKASSLSGGNTRALMIISVSATPDGKSTMVWYAELRIFEPTVRRRVVADLMFVIASDRVLARGDLYTTTFSSIPSRNAESHVT